MPLMLGLKRGCSSTTLVCSAQCCAASPAMMLATALLSACLQHYRLVRMSPRAVHRA